MQVRASLNNLRVSPRKARIAAKLIIGLDVKDALIQLDQTVKKTCPFLIKLLNSAIANGENNFGIDRENMYVYDARVNAGAVLKRWMPKAFGRAGKILKRTSKVDLTISERIEGKNRKTKEQLDAQRKKRMEEKKKEEKAMEEKNKDTKEKTAGATEKKAEGEEKIRETKQKRGWGSRIFRRKSM